MTISFQVSTRQYHTELAELVRGMVPSWVTTRPAGHPEDQPFNHRMVLAANPEVSVLEMNPITGQTGFVQTNYLDLLEVHFIVNKVGGSGGPGAISLSVHNVETTMRLRLYDRLRDFLARKTGVTGEHWLFSLEDAGVCEDQSLLQALQAFSKACVQVEQSMAKTLLAANGDQQNLLLLANLQGGLRDFAANSAEYESAGRPREFAVSISQLNTMLGQLDHLREVRTKMPGVVSLLPFILDERMPDGSFNAMALVRAYLERSLGGISPKDLQWLEQLPSIHGTYVLTLLSNLSTWSQHLTDEHAPLLLSFIRQLEESNIPILPPLDSTEIYTPNPHVDNVLLPNFVLSHVIWIMQLPTLVTSKLNQASFSGFQPQDLDTLSSLQIAAQAHLFQHLTRWALCSDRMHADQIARLREELKLWATSRGDILDYVADLIKDHTTLLKQQLNAGWGWWQTSSDTWHEMIAIRNLQTVDKSSWFTGMPKRIILRGHAHVLSELRPVEVVITPLTTAYDLALEGQRMKHCVGGYAHTCVSGRSRIFNVTQNYLDQETGAWVKVASGTLELVWSDNNPSRSSKDSFFTPAAHLSRKYYQSQFRGLQNQSVTQEAAKHVADFLSYYTTMTEGFLSSFGSDHDEVSRKVLERALATGVTERDQRLGFITKQLRDGKLFIVPTQHILHGMKGATRTWGIELASHTQLQDDALVLDINIHLPKSYLEAGMTLLRDAFSNVLPPKVLFEQPKTLSTGQAVRDEAQARDQAFELVNKFEDDFRTSLVRDLYALVQGLKTSGNGDRNWLHNLLLAGRGQKATLPEDTPPTVGPPAEEEAPIPEAAPVVAEVPVA